MPGVAAAGAVNSLPLAHAAMEVGMLSRRTALFSLLGALELLLTLIGTGGVTAYAVARRTQEIGVRMAFGADPRSVVWTMMRDATWPVAAGLAVGLGGACFASRLVASFLFETTPNVH